MSAIHIVHGVDSADCVLGVSKTLLNCIFAFFGGKWKFICCGWCGLGNVWGWWMGDGVGSSLEASKVLTCVFRPHNFTEVRIHRWLRTCIDCKSRVKG